jgi:hypothetical protein
MSKWPMRGHFGHLRFKTFPMKPRTPRCNVFWALLSNSKNSGVSKDSKSPTLGVWVSSSHLAKVGLPCLINVIQKIYKRSISINRPHRSTSNQIVISSIIDLNFDLLWVMIDFILSINGYNNFLNLMPFLNISLVYVLAWDTFLWCGC